MSSKKMQFQSTMFDYDSDEFWELHAALIPVLEKHFADVLVNFNASSEAHRFISTYKAALADFWEGEKAADALYKLSKTLGKLTNEWSNVPRLVKDDLLMNAGVFDDENKAKFYEDNSHRLVYKSECPNDYGREAVRALDTLFESESTLIPSIEKTIKELPAGIPIRNRPIKEWSVIYAAADLVRAFDAMSVPSGIDSSNPSGPFCKLLEELFPLFKTTNSVAGTFKGWKANSDNKIKISDLMPI